MLGCILLKFLHNFPKFCVFQAKNNPQLVTFGLLLFTCGKHFY